MTKKTVMAAFRPRQGIFLLELMVTLAVMLLCTSMARWQLMAIQKDMADLDVLQRQYEDTCSRWAQNE